MTLLTIANNMADETKGARPATIASNTNPDAQHALRIINKVGNWMMKAHPWQILRTEKTFTTVATEEQTGALPSDFDRFVPETFWDRSSNNLLSGPIGPVEWQGLKVQSFASQNKKFTIRGGAILTQPVFAAGDTCAFEYIKKNWCDIAAGSGEKAAFTIDSDVGLIDEELITLAAIYEYLDSEGLPAARAARQLKLYVDKLAANERASGGVAVVADIFALNTRHFEGSPKPSRASYGGDF
tara:strand:- start:8050 stop:8772 length:723 start_codon:yes stop_codon:yes gene_type:complete